MFKSKSVVRSLAIVLLIMLVVGCSSNTNSSNNNSGQTGGNNNAQQPSQTPSNTQGGEKEEDRGEPIVINIMRPGAAGDSPEIPRVEKAIEDSFYEMYGINIDYNLYFYAWDQVEQKLTLDFAAGEAPDAMRLTRAMAYKMWDQGYLQPVTDLAKEHTPNLFKHMHEGEIDWASYKGEMIGYPMGGFAIATTIVMREDKLKDLGMEMPTTVAEFEEVMAAYKKKYPEEYPFHGTNQHATKYMKALSGVQAGAYSLKSDGTVTISLLDDNMWRYNELARRWYENGFVSKDFLTQGDESEAEFIEDKGLTMVAYHSSPLRNIEKTIEGGFNENAVGRVMPHLIADWGDQTAPFDGYSGEGLFVIPVTTSPEKAEIVAKLINWELDSLVNFMYGKRGELGVDWEFIDEENLVLDKMPKWKESGSNGYSWEHYFINRANFSDELAFLSYTEPKGYEQVMEYQATGRPIDSPVMKYPHLPVEEMAVKIDELQVKIGQLQSEIIIGRRPLSDWDQAQKIWEDGGGKEIDQRLTEIFNELESN